MSNEELIKIIKEQRDLMVELRDFLDGYNGRLMEHGRNALTMDESITSWTKFLGEGISLSLEKVLLVEKANHLINKVDDSVLLENGEERTLRP